MNTTIFATLNHYTCPSCGVIYGLESGFDKARRANGEGFYCPNGHRLSYKESDLHRAEKAAKRAQELLEAERRRLEEMRASRDAADRRASAAKGQVTKLKNRAAAGVCPCCTRNFGNLARHMKDMHPDFTKGDK